MLQHSSSPKRHPEPRHDASPHHSPQRWKPSSADEDIPGWRQRIDGERHHQRCNRRLGDGCGNSQILLRCPVPAPLCRRQKCKRGPPIKAFGKCRDLLWDGYASQAADAQIGPSTAHASLLGSCETPLATENKQRFWWRRRVYLCTEIQAVTVSLAASKYQFARVHVVVAVAFLGFGHLIIYSSRT